MRLLFITESQKFFDWLVNGLEDHECIHAKNIEEAAHEMGLSDFDAVFLDPDIHGEVIQSAACARALTKAPLIILAGQAIRADIAALCDGVLYREDMNHGRQLPDAVKTYAEKRRDAHPLDRTTELFNALSHMHA